MLYLLIGVFIAWVLYYTIYDWCKVRVHNFPPGPLTLPLIGGLYSLNPKCPHVSIEKLVKKFGKVFNIRMGPMGPMVFVHDINLINQVFENTEYNNRPEMAIFDLLNKGANGIGSCKYDKRWKKIYKLLHSGMTKITMNKLEETSLKSFDQLINKLLQKANIGENYNPTEDFLKTYSAIFSSLVYGIESETLDSIELQTRIKYHDAVMTMLNPMHPMNIFPFLWKLTTPVKNKLTQCLKERDTLFNESYEKHVEDFDGKLRDLIDIITEFELSKQNAEEMDNVLKEIRKEDMFLSAWTMYLAGCDTTSSVTRWLMLYLCINPHVQETIQQEVDDITGRDMEGTLEQKDKLHYTRATILEALRCSSPTGIGLPRVSSKNQQLGGYNLPKGTIIMLNQWHIHHNEDLWPEPFAFKPERFLDETGTLYSNYHIFKKMPFIPFSRGKRSCIGQHIAMDLILVFVVELMRQVTIQLPKHFVPDLAAEVKLILQPKPFMLSVSKRQRNDKYQMEE